jgi:CBS domain-containing protein/sporulation protein YlmC with PRC-barrel domain
MISVSTFFFSRIAGNSVYSPDGKAFGRLRDLVADPSFKRPKIVAAIVSSQDGLKTVDFSYFGITKAKGQYRLECEEMKPVSLEGIDAVHIAKHVQDRQIVDMNGRKLVRVNDVKVAMLATGAYLVAADVGLEGLLRRLGFAKPLQRFLRLFKASLPSRLILWDDVETISFGHAGIRLSKDTSNLDRLHPSDLADIIEDMDHNTQLEVFSALGRERAADVLEELESDTRESLLESLPMEKMADVLEIMPADEVADILDELGSERAEEFLSEMESEASGEVRELMEYEDYEVGSIMTTDFICFRDGNTVGETLEVLRREKPESDTVYYLYIVSSRGELEATVSLRDIVISELDTKLSDIMNEDVVYVQDTDRLESLNEIIAKYNLLAVPVVDANKLLLGMVIINDVMYHLLRNKRKRL